MVKEQIRKTGTEAALREAFWRLYIQKPISKITIKELTRVAGVHRSSFYGHYEDIYDLLEKSEQELLDEIKTYMNVDRSIAEGLSPFDVIVTFYQENLEKVAALMGEHGDPGFLIRLREKIVPWFMKLLTIPEENTESYYILDFVVTAMLTFLTSWFHREGDVPPTDIVISIRQAILHGCEQSLLKNAVEPQAVSHHLDFL